MRLKQVVILSLLAAVFAFNPGSEASGGRFNEGEKQAYRSKDGMRSKICRELDLTEEQKDRLYQFRGEYTESKEDIYKQIRDKKSELGRELSGKDIDLDKVSEVHSEIKRLKAEAEDNRLNSILAVREILTPEQFALFSTEYSSDYSREKRPFKRDKDR
jgi:Spy/CpxP family protein refolding chaperone